MACCATHEVVEGSEKPKLWEESAVRGASGSRRCSRGRGRWREMVRLEYIKRLLLRGSFKGAPVTPPHFLDVLGFTKGSFCEKLAVPSYRPHMPSRERALTSLSVPSPQERSSSSLTRKPHGQVVTSARQFASKRSAMCGAVAPARCSRSHSRLVFQVTQRPNFPNAISCFRSGPVK